MAQLYPGSLAWPVGDFGSPQAEVDWGIELIVGPVAHPLQLPLAPDCSGVFHDFAEGKEEGDSLCEPPG